MDLGRTGIWSSALRYGDGQQAAEAAAELESLGYSTLWVPDVGGDVFASVDRLLGATSSATIATGILNLWMHSPEETAAHHAAFARTHGARFMMGIGVSHQLLIDLQESGRYRKPLARMVEFLDGLDAAEVPVPADQRMLAALGPKMLELARDRSAGSHPYLVTPELTARARAGVGPDRLVAVELGVVLEADPARAREVARTHLAGYVVLPNYANNWKRAGFTDQDTAEGGSDRLVDALVAWGDEDAIAARVEEHRAAGADHVCIQVLTADPTEFPVDQWRRLAPVLATR